MGKQTKGSKKKAKTADDIADEMIVQANNMEAKATEYRRVAGILKGE